jgi:formylglycine-generating enzyme required for sulfatase activity
MTTLPSLLVTLLVVLMTGLASVRPASAVDSIRVALTPSDNTMEFVYIRPGTFLVGSDPQKHPDRREERLSGDRRMWVEITEGFYLGRYEVTQAQWESVMGGAAPHAPSKPQVHISWENTQEFLQILNDAAGEDHFRLPTEAEWEYACRAESGDSDWWFGNYPSDLGDLHSHAFAESHWVSEPQDVTSHPPDGDAENDWGLVHMHGNVWEWVQDWFYFDYDELHRSCNETGTTEADACKDPEVRRDEWSGSPGHVNRGGAFDSGGLRSTRSASRASFYTGNGTFNIGFRVVYTGDPPAFRVDIDIKPGSDHNPVNLKSKGVIPVAILTTESFDASTVDGSSVEFAGASAAHGDGHLEDVDGDGDVDWIGHFKTQDVSIASGDEEAALAGTTVDGMEVEGSDVVDPIGSDRGRGRNKPTGDSTTWGEVKKSVQ